MNYSSRDPSKIFETICKRRSVVEMAQIMIPPVIAKRKIPLAPEKRSDVMSLIESRFGKDWRESDNDKLDFYREIFSDNGSDGSIQHDHEHDDDNEGNCNCGDADLCLM